MEYQQAADKNFLEAEAARERREEERAEKRRKEDENFHSLKLYYSCLISRRLNYIVYLINSLLFKLIAQNVLASIFKRLFQYYSNIKLVSPMPVF